MRSEVGGASSSSEVMSLTRPLRSVICSAGWHPSDLEPDGSHQFEAVALGDDALAQAIVEFHAPIFKLILEVNVVQVGADRAVHLGQGEVMGADQPNGAAVDQGQNDAFGADSAIFRVGALQQLVEQEENGESAGSEIENLAQTLDLGVEARAALVQGVVD